MSKLVAFYALMLFLSCSLYLTNIVVHAGSNGLSTMTGQRQLDFWGGQNSKDPSNTNLSDPFSYGR